MNKVLNALSTLSHMRGVEENQDVALLSAGIYDFIYGKMVRNEDMFNALVNLHSNPDYQIDVLKMRVISRRWGSEALKLDIRVKAVKNIEIHKEPLIQQGMNEITIPMIINYRNGQFSHSAWTCSLSLIYPVLVELVNAKVKKYKKRLLGSSRLMDKLRFNNLQVDPNIFFYNIYKELTDFTTYSEGDKKAFAGITPNIYNRDVEKLLPKESSFETKDKNSFILHMFSEGFDKIFSPMEVTLNRQKTDLGQILKCLKYQLFDVIEGKIENYSDVAIGFKDNFGKVMRKTLEDNIDNWRLNSYDLHSLSLSVSLRVDDEELDFSTNSYSIQKTLDKLQELDCKEVLYRGIVKTINGKCLVHMLEAILEKQSSNADKHTFIRELASYSGER